MHCMAKIELKKVETKKDLKAFVRFPYELYKGNAYWVPPLEFDEMNVLDKAKNPSFEHCEADYWLAYKDGVLAGRVAAIINKVANEKWGGKVRFGWLEFIEDIEVLRALIDQVVEWGRERGMKVIQGPLGFNDMDKEGLLVEGFDKLPTIANIYNHPYYPTMLEELGFHKDEDWIQYIIKVTDVPEKVKAVSEGLARRYNVRAVIFDKKKDVLKYGKSMFHTLNAAFKDLYGYAELSDKEIQSLINTYFSFIDPKFVCFVLDEHDDVVGFGVSMPSLSKAFQKAKGKIFPFGFIHLLKALRQRDVIDLYLNGVLPEWQNRGIHALYYTKLTQAYMDAGFKYAITNPQLETNVNAVRIWRNYEQTPYIKRRCYSKEI